MICTFFGHRDAPGEIRTKIEEIIINLIESKNVNLFYVGNNGAFDGMIRRILKDIKNKYDINYYVVLAYIPKNDEFSDYSDTIYFDELNSVPHKFRIIERNKIMLKKADYVVTYVRRIGNVKDLKELAENNGKYLINI